MGFTFSIIGQIYLDRLFPIYSHEMTENSSGPIRMVIMTMNLIENFDNLQMNWEIYKFSRLPGAKNIPQWLAYNRRMLRIPYNRCIIICCFSCMYGQLFTRILVLMKT